MTLPSRITEEARKIAADQWMDSIGKHALVRRISQALLAAEQRGREMEREEVASHAKRILEYLSQNASVGDEVSAEIGRALLALAGERHKVTGEPFTHPLIRSRATEG